MPIPKREEDMAGEGWYKELTIKKIVINAGVVFCQEYDFYAQSLPCKQREGRGGPPCGTDHVYLKCQGGKLLWCCFKHKRAMGPLTFDVGAKASEYPISAMKAIEICAETGQEIPEELKAMAATEKSRTARRKRPTKKVG